MFTPFVAVFCSLVVLSWGAVCVPDQWVGENFDFWFGVDLVKGEVKDMTKKRVETAYDYTNKRLSQFEYYDPDSTPYRHNIYIANEQNTTAYVINLLENECATAVYPGSMPRTCMSEDARYIGTTDYGLDQVFETQVYNESSAVNGYQKQTIRKVDKDTYAPVLNIQYGRTPYVVFTATMTSYNMVRGIKNTTVFVVPKICDQVVPKQMKLPMPQHPFSARFASLHKDW